MATRADETGTIELKREPDFELGKLAVRPSVNEIVSARGTARVEPRVMQVCVALAKRAGVATTREELLRSCWGEIAVSDDALGRCISRLRRLFEDHAPEVTIETVSKVGYRLRVAPRPSQDFSRLRTMLVTACGLLAVLALALLAGPERRAPSSSDASLARPFTSLPGLEQWPAISPRGGQIAFAFRPPAAEFADLYVQSVGGSTPLQLTSSGSHDYYPVWSPDGGHIAFARRTGVDGECTIHRVAATGGPARLLGSCGGGSLMSMDWSPSGATLVFTAHDAEGSMRVPFLFDLDTRTTTTLDLSIPPAAFVEDVAFSPDGAQLGYTVVTALGVEDLHVYSFEAATTRRITHDNLKIHGFDWLPAGDGLVMSSNRGGAFALWLVSLGGHATPIPGTAAGADEPKVSSTGRLVYETWNVRTSLRERRKEDNWEARELAPSTRMEWDASRSPDGELLSFLSDRSGAAEIWIAGPDGSQARRLTELSGPYTHTPRFSPDGRCIAYAAPVNGNFDVFVLDLATGVSDRLTSSPAEDFAPTWSRDGRYIFFGSTRSGSWQIWRLDLGSGEKTQATTAGGRAAQISPNGRSLYYVKADRAGLWRSPFTGGLGLEPESLLIEDLEPVDWNNWFVQTDVIYYVKREQPDSPAIWRHRISEGRSEPVLSVPTLLHKSGLWVANGGRSMLLAEVESREADLMWLDLAR